MGNPNWEATAKGLGQVLSSMAKFEQKKADVMSQMYQANQKQDSSWFNKKRELDYRQELEQKDTSKQGYLDVQRRSLELRENEAARLNQEDEALVNNVKRQIRFSEHKDWSSQLKDFQEQGLLDRFDFTSKEMQELVVKRFGKQIEPEAKKDGINVFDWLKSFTKGKQAELAATPIEDEGKPFIDEKNVDTKAVEFLAPQIQTQEDMDEFMQNAEAQGLSQDTINQIMEIVDQRIK